MATWTKFEHWTCIKILPTGKWLKRWKAFKRFLTFRFYASKQGTYLVCPFLWCTFMFSNLLLYSSTCSSKTFLCHLLKIDPPYVLKLLSISVLSIDTDVEPTTVIDWHSNWRLNLSSLYPFFPQHTESSIIWTQCLHLVQLLAIVSLYA